jgi:hypothetical protein
VLNIDVGLRSAGRPISALRSSWKLRCASQISESESSSESCINDTASGSYDSARASAGYVSEYVQVCGGSIRNVKETIIGSWHLGYCRRKQGREIGVDGR